MTRAMGGARGSQQKILGPAVGMSRGCLEMGRGVDASRAGVVSSRGDGGGVDMSRAVSRYADGGMWRRAGRGYTKCVQTMDTGSTGMARTLDTSTRN